MRFLKFVDAINEWMGRAAGWLLVPLTLLIVFDVTMRYVLDMPTIWGWDLNVQIQGAIVIMAGGYALLHGGHVSVDIMVMNLSARKRAIINSVMYIFLVGGLGLLFYYVSKGSIASLIMQEHYTSTWGPPIYPLKLIMMLGIAAMFLQGIANWVRNISTAINGEAELK